MTTPVCLEVGSKRVFACSLDWPGWCRSDKTEEAAERLASFVAAIRDARAAPGGTGKGLALPQLPTPAPGWYPEPETGTLCWWDGARWTEHRHAPPG